MFDYDKITFYTINIPLYIHFLKSPYFLHYNYLIVLTIFLILVILKPKENVMCFSKTTDLVPSFNKNQYSSILNWLINEIRDL